MGKLVDLTGQKFHYLIVLGRVTNCSRGKLR